MLASERDCLILYPCVEHFVGQPPVPKIPTPNSCCSWYCVYYVQYCVLAHTCIPHPSWARMYQGSSPCRQNARSSGSCFFPAKHFAKSYKGKKPQQPFPRAHRRALRKRIAVAELEGWYPPPANSWVCKKSIRQAGSGRLFEPGGVGLPRYNLNIYIKWWQLPWKPPAPRVRKM